MKKSTSKVVLLLFGITILFLISSSCEKEENCQNFTPFIPYTFIYLINQTEWVAEVPFSINSGQSNVRVSYNKDTGYFRIYANKENHENNVHQVIGFTAWEQEDNIFLFEYDDEIFLDRNDTNVCYGYELDTLSNQSLEITEINAVNNRIIGNFEVFLTRPECGDSIHISNAEFNAYHISIQSPNLFATKQSLS